MRFLISVFKRFQFKKLTGLDVSLPTEKIIKHYQEIEFIKRDITEFSLNDKYDIVYSNHVLEHMGPLDLDSHILSIKKSLNYDGKFIFNLPNKLFGPSDITRIKDFTYTNSIPAVGSHFFESTYAEVIDKLREHGFDQFYSPIPHTFIRHVFPKIRIRSEIIAKIEQSRSFIRFLHLFKINGRCRLNYEISIIASCSKNE